MLLNCDWLIRQLTQRDHKVILLHVLSKRIIHIIDTKNIFVPRQRCFFLWISEQTVIIFLYDID